MTRPIIKPYLRGLAIGILFIAATVLLLGLAGFLDVEHEGGSQQWWISLAGVILVLVGWMIQGAAEEVVARGFLMPILGTRWNPLLGVMVSSLFFSVIHLFNPNLSAISLLNLFLFGLFAALYALYEGGLWGIFAIHSAWNWAQGNLFGFSVSGLSIDWSILYDLMEVGPDWITGGLFGPEGGAGVTLMLLIGIGAVALLGRRRTNNKAEAVS
jgi:membrane protease YdiL (CAAX protease family)